MTRVQKSVVLLAAILVPAAAHSTFAPNGGEPCFASGTATYRIDPDASAADFRIKVTGDTPRPDLRMQLVDRAEIADFVLVDDFSGREQTPCRSMAPVQTVSLDAGAKPDVTVRLSAAADADASDYKIYVHSVRFSQQDAAALLAAMWKADQRREATGSIPRR